jgi:hypothetical protein
MGGKCKDGVVLTADKKISYPETNAYQYREKLFIFQKDYFCYQLLFPFMAVSVSVSVIPASKLTSLFLLI